jgi:hypothetical protein
MHAAPVCGRCRPPLRDVACPRVAFQRRVFEAPLLTPRSRARTRVRPARWVVANAFVRARPCVQAHSMACATPSTLQSRSGRAQVHGLRIPSAPSPWAATPTLDTQLTSCACLAGHLPSFSRASIPQLHARVPPGPEVCCPAFSCAAGVWSFLTTSKKPKVNAPVAPERGGKPVPRKDAVSQAAKPPPGGQQRP